MSSQNNEGVFFLDDIGSPPSAPPRGLTSSPIQGASTTPTETANSSRGSSPTASPHKSVVDMPSVGQGQGSSIGNQASSASTFLGPPAAPIPKHSSSTTSTLLGTSLHKRPIHATPSAPSPLARASIVPHSSDCDSSSNDSAVLSDEEEDCMDVADMNMEFRQAIDAHAGSASAHKEKFSLGSPRNQALNERTDGERVGVGSYGGMFTPGSLLRGKRSDSGSSQSQGSNSSGAVSVPSHKDFGTSHAPVFEGSPSPLSYQAYPRQRSESFGSSMDPLMVNTNSGEGMRKRSDSIGSAGGHPPGTIGGLGSLLGFSTTIPERRRTIDKGKGKEVWPVDTAVSGSMGTSVGTSSTMSPKASPRRERGSLRATASLAGDRYVDMSVPPLVSCSLTLTHRWRSPGKSRRFSEYSGSEGRRLSISSSSGLSRSFAAPIVPHAISTISPLNPLPSPWGNSGDDLKGTSRSATSDSPTSSSSGAIRLNPVPSSVRLATDLLKSTPNASSNDSSMIIPPLSAGMSRQTGSDARQHQDSDLTATMPSTPVATRNATPEEVPVLGDASGNLPLVSSALTNEPESNLSSSPVRFTKTSNRVRPSLPPPSAFTLLNDPPVESPPLAQEELPFTADRTTWLGPASATDMPALGVLGKGLTAAPRDRSLSATDAMSSSDTNQAGVGLGINVSTSYGTRLSTKPFAHDNAGLRRTGERSLHSANYEWTDPEGDAARHANLIMQTRRAKLQKWRPASAERDDRAFGPTATLAPPRLGRTLSASGFETGPENLSAWKFQKTAPASVRQGEALIDESISSAAGSLKFPKSSLSPAAINLQEGFNLEVPFSDSTREGKIPMEKVPSTESTVNGIEWVDWLDEYKKYKEAKIRSEEENTLQPGLSNASSPQQSAPQTSLLFPSIPSENADKESKSAPSQVSPHFSKQSTPETAPQLDTTSKPPPAARSQETSSSKLSRALSHTGEVLQRTASRTDSKRLPSMTSSNPQNMYLRQTSYSHKGSAKKTKGLGNKIEGWWHSVKTNFQNPAGGSHPSPKILPFPPKGSISLERERPSQAKTPVIKVPSAPPSRRGSVMPLHSDIPAAPATFSEEMEEQAHVMRTATSHTNLVRLNEDMSPTHRAEEVFEAPSSPVPAPMLAHRQASDPIRKEFGGDRVQRLIPIQKAATGLEARRKQPALSLKLDQQRLSLPHQAQRQYSDGSTAASASGFSSSTGSRDATNYSRQTSSIGLATGLTGWDQTPSPLQALNARQPQGIDVQSPPQIGAVEFSKDSVQRHVKHRLTVAKESCDKDLQAIISEITAYVEEHLQRERQLPPDIPLEEEGDSGAPENTRRAFGSVSSIGTDGGMTTSFDAETSDRDSTMLPSGES